MTNISLDNVLIEIEGHLELSGLAELRILEGGRREWVMMDRDALRQLAAQAVYESEGNDGVAIVSRLARMTGNPFLAFRQLMTDESVYRFCELLKNQQERTHARTNRS